MIFLTIFKNWKLLLDIALVAGVIIAFTLWDPFSIFTNTKTKATANLVTGVREIGQLVTAEYYGEVIASLKESELSKYAEDTVTEVAKELFVELKKELEYDDDNNLEKKAERAVKKDDRYKDIYDKLIAFLASEYFDKELKKVFKERKEIVKSGWENKVLKKLFNENNEYRKKLGDIHRLDRRARKKEEERALRDQLIEEDYSNYLDSIPPFLDGFYQAYIELTGAHLSVGKANRRDIALIGRGWVKAGFDFGKLDESNFLYDKERKTIHFFGIKPVILDADINPWFIPERNVKGFELINFHPKATFEEAVQVKKLCKEKLLEQARRAEIVTKALNNGREALKNFFSLLLNEPGISVEFHEHPYDLQYAAIAADTLIDISEASLINSIYRAEMDSIKKLDSLASVGLKDERKDKRIEHLSRFINNLKKLNFIDSSQTFSFYSITAARILSDDFFIDTGDIHSILFVRDTLKVDANDKNKLTTGVVSSNTIWFSDGNFQKEFNDMLGLLEKKGVFSEEYADTITNFTAGNDTVVFYKGKTVKVQDTTLVQGTIQFITFVYTDTVKTDDLASLQYNLNYYTQLPKYTEIGDTNKVKVSLDSIFNATIEKGAMYDLHAVELASVKKAAVNKFKYEYRVAPVKQLITLVQEYLPLSQNKYND